MEELAAELPRMLRAAKKNDRIAANGSERELSGRWPVHSEEVDRSGGFAVSQKTRRQRGSLLRLAGEPRRDTTAPDGLQTARCCLSR